MIFFSRLHLSEPSDANWSSSAYALKQVIDFLHEPLENSDSIVFRLPPNKDLIGGI